MLRNKRRDVYQRNYRRPRHEGIVLPAEPNAADHPCVQRLTVIMTRSFVAFVVATALAAPASAQSAGR